MTQELIEKAYEILRENDRGHYTVPTKGLYPFQWNWDSCLTALAFAYFDEARAWQEIETLFDHQWEDGMVPHIVFHEHDDGYFPGPDVWGTSRPVPTSGITQPPVAGLVLRQIFERAKDKELACEKATLLLPKILAWHEWFYQNRDPESEGLVAVIHPWETGRDNSVDWDEALMAVPTDGVKPYTRRDTQHANPDHRPTKAQYDRYISLLHTFRALEWDNSKLHNASSFQVVDPGMNAILIRSSRDMVAVARALNDRDTANRFESLADIGTQALEKLWSFEFGQYLCYDRYARHFVENPSVGGILPVLASGQHAAEIALRLRSLRKACNYLVPSQDPNTAQFDSLRYWRGPTWLIVNYLIKTGLQSFGEGDVAKIIVEDSLKLIEESGFAEYYDPISAEPCGGGRFTWTAAMVIEFLAEEAEGETLAN